MTICGWRFYAFLGLFCWGGTLLARWTNWPGGAAMLAWISGSIFLFEAARLRSKAKIESLAKLESVLAGIDQTRESLRDQAVMLLRKMSERHFEGGPKETIRLLQLQTDAQLLLLTIDHFDDEAELRRHRA